MRRIHVGAQVSIDGVMQAPGGPHEDPANGFRFGGWALPHFDEEALDEMSRMFHAGSDLLLGRKTYEIFAAYWPYQDEAAPHGGFAAALNRPTKYVVSRSGQVDLGWTPSVLLPDLAAVAKLKRQDGPDLLTQGSTELVHGLFAQDLVDALTVVVVPVVLGTGKRLFADGAAPRSFRLSRSRACRGGVVVAHYEKAGPVEAAQVENGADAPNPRELARRQRMDREG